MAELDGITAALRRLRTDLDQLMEDTATRSNQTTELIEKIEELRRRAEEVQRTQTKER